MRISPTGVPSRTQRRSRRRLVATVAGLPAAALAAMPYSITLTRAGESADGLRFEVHAVACSDGSVRAITAWNQRRLWCQGDGGNADCGPGMVAAAIDACRR